MHGVRRSLAAIATSAALAVAAIPATTAAAAELDEATYSVCQAVADPTRTVSAKQASQLARQFGRLAPSRARKRISAAFADAGSRAERRRATRSAYAWCDGSNDAYRTVPLTLSTPANVDVVDTDVTTITGTAVPGATILATVAAGTAGASTQFTAPADATGAFAVPITGITMGSSTVRLSATAPLYAPSTFAAPITLHRTESEGAFKASAQEIPADELVKDPAALKGRRIYGHAEVFQYDSRTGLSTMLVYVTVVNPGRFEFWTDAVQLRLVVPTLGNGIDQDDIVEYWGEVEGPYSYTTAIGGSNTVPAVNVRFLGLVEKR